MQKDDVGGSETEVHPFVERLMQVIENHYTDSAFNVESFSTNMRISRVQLFKKTKALLDTSPSQLLKSYRLDQSREMLRTGQYTVSEVAYQSGFSSPEYFSRVFKEQYGVSPINEKKITLFLSNFIVS